MGTLCGNWGAHIVREPGSDTPPKTGFGEHWGRGSKIKVFGRFLTPKTVLFSSVKGENQKMSSEKDTCRPAGSGLRSTLGAGDKMTIFPQLFFRKNSKPGLTVSFCGFWKNTGEDKNDGARPPDTASIVG